jgi:pimeloyl-ACP methyl ester carboxylesterase
MLKKLPLFLLVLVALALVGVPGVPSLLALWRTTSAQTPATQSVFNWRASSPWNGPFDGPVDANGNPWWSSSFNDLGWSPVLLPDVDSFPNGADRFYRASFDVADPTSFPAVTFGSDDGLWIYVNDSLAGHWGGNWREGGCANNPAGVCSINTNVPPQFVNAHLREGVNVIAVRVSNGGCCHSYFTFGLSASTTSSFDAANDFSPTMNPNGPWSYGYMPLGGSFTAFDQSGQIAVGIDAWRSQSVQSLRAPGVYHNGTSSVAVAPGGITFAPGQMSFHPGPNGERSVVRFTAPSAGDFAIDAAFDPADPTGTTTDVHVVKNGIALFDGNVSGTPASGTGEHYNAVLTLTAGDVIDFMVGFGADGAFYNDSTYLSVTISAPGTPTPSPLPSPSPTPSPGPTPIQRAVIFIQGIDSESREGESPAGCTSPYLGFIRSDQTSRADWIASYLSDPAHVGGVLFEKTKNFFYFSYSGQYCLQDGIQDLRRPIYKSRDTCDGIVDAANRLQTMLGALIARYPGVKFDLVAHSMGGVVSAYWLVQHGNDPTINGPMKSYIHSLVTFDSPLRGVAIGSPTTHCNGILGATQSWDDMLCAEPGHSSCPIIDALAGFPTPGPRIFTIDATQPRVLGVQDVPSERTTLPYTNSALHCAFDDSHGSVWESDVISGPPPAECLADFHFSDHAGQLDLYSPSANAKSVFVACAVASSPVSQCLSEIGTSYQPAAALPGPVPAASSEIPVQNASFSIGDFIRINPGMPNQEENQVVGFGSIILASPLQFDHEAGEPIVIVGSGPTSTSTATPTLSPTPGAATPTPTPTPSGATQLWGDIDCNGSLTIGDAQKIARFLIGLAITQGPDCPLLGTLVQILGVERAWGDVDCLNGVTIGDAQKIARSLINLSVGQGPGCPQIGQTT